MFCLWQQPFLFTFLLKNKVFVWDAHLKKAVLELEFGTPVLNVKIRDDMIIVILKTKIYGWVS